MEPIVDLPFIYRLFLQAPIHGLAKYPDSALSPLDDAHRRYLHVCGLAIDGANEQTELDRILFLNLPPNADSVDSSSAARKQVEFLHRITTFPRSWCAAWWYSNFVAEISLGLVPGEPAALMDNAHALALELSRSDADERQSTCGQPA